MEYPAATMTPETTPKDAGEAYSLVKNLIFDQVHKFHQQFGGDFDDLVGEAHEAFLLTHNQYLTGKANSGRVYTNPFATEVRYEVWCILFDKMRTHTRRQAAHPFCCIAEGQDFASHEYEFKLEQFTEELSEDARFTVELLLNPPEEIEAVAIAKGGEPRNYRSTVRDWLQRHGWGVGRIDTAFNEVKGALA